MSIRDYADVIVATIEHLFPKGSPEVQGKVFVVSVGISLDDFSSDEVKASVYTTLHLAIVASSNYVGVYAAASRMSGGWRALEWKLVARHDSAWRDDGVRSALCDGRDDLVKIATEKLKPAKASSLSEHRRIAFMGILPAAAVFGETDPSTLPRGRPDVAAAAQS